MKTVAFVPVRLNSKRVVGKNLKLLGGKPLMCWLLETLVQVEGIDEVYLYCSNEQVKTYLPQGVRFLQRPESLDSDETLGETIYDEFTRTIDADIYILAHTTSPFIKVQTIQQALHQVQSGEYDSAFSVERLQTFAWYRGKPLNYSLQHVPRTQTIEPIMVETSAFYMFRSEIWKQHRQRIGFHPWMAEVDRVEGLDIDWPNDFALAETVVGKL